jgi:hypothetical protein
MTLLSSDALYHGIDLSDFAVVATDIEESDIYIATPEDKRMLPNLRKVKYKIVTALVNNTEKVTNSGNLRPQRRYSPLFHSRIHLPYTTPAKKFASRYVNPIDNRHPCTRA